MWILRFGLALLLAAGPAFGQAPTAGPPAAATVRVPSYWDEKARVEKPNLSTLRVIRWATGEAYPPFHYADADGQPVGFAVDLARAVCVELGVQCTMQAWRWEALLDTIGNDRADAIIAMLRPTEQIRARFTVSERFHQPMGRFVTLKDGPLREVRPEALAGKTVATIAGSGHEEFLRRFFPDATVRAFPRAEDARIALKAKVVDALFADGVALALWLNGSSSESCCRFVGGAFLDEELLGQGIGVLIARDKDVLGRAIGYALHQLDEKGIYAEIYLRHFPLGFY
jgi:polar amino acid transport system substrate-binding protein